MNFLNIGPWELTVIFLIAILVVGPERLVTFVRSIGKMTRRMRALSGEFLNAVRSEVDVVQQTAREAVEGTKEVTQVATEAVQGEVEATQQEADQSLESIIRNELGLSTIQRDLAETQRETQQVIQGVMSDVAKETVASPGVTEKQDQASQPEAEDGAGTDEGSEDLQEEIQRRLGTDG